MTEDAEAVVRQYSDTVERQDWDGLRELVTDDFVIHEPESIDPEPQDFDDHLEVLKAFEWRIEQHDVFSDGDKVASRETLYAVQIEEFEGLPPSDTELSVTSILIWRIEDGKIAEVWSSPDSYEFMDQMGATFPQILVTIPKVLIRKLLP